jgi:hypothetical protein
MKKEKSLLEAATDMLLNCHNTPLKEDNLSENVTKDMLDAIPKFNGQDVETLLTHMVDSFSHAGSDKTTLSRDIYTSFLVRHLKDALHDWKKRRNK